ncbi:uncharacterized protein [Amphiura filiformis]|uniref:uncharacterized protein n=1 Tax=Amphiura filiformis TaxID=82378 RepID=UPI003B20C21B
MNKKFLFVGQSGVQAFSILLLNFIEILVFIRKHTDHRLCTDCQITLYQERTQETRKFISNSILLNTQEIKIAIPHIHHFMMAASASTIKEWKTEKYVDQKQKNWPNIGKHILAQYDEDSVIVYQAFCPEIADYATTNQRFGGPKFSFTRMSWIKTNFLWMMYRCGWASKPNQEHVLAIWIKRDGFDEILSKAYTPGTQKQANVSKDDVLVRLQWDPDHTPDGTKEQRRAIQLGLKGEILKKYATEYILKIEDITPFVLSKRPLLTEKKMQHLIVAQERVYPVQDDRTAELIGVDKI